MKCEYGCNQDAKYKLKSGKWCCNTSYKKCPNILKKNKEGQQKRKTLKECPYCHKMISFGIGGQYDAHLNSCKDMYSKKVFLQQKDFNKYRNWYNKIIEYRQNNPLIYGYKEKHHIIPKSLGGSNDKSNLIYLTAKEHYICHLLLVEIYRNDKIAFNKMLSAFMIMKSRGITSKQYDKKRIEFSSESHKNQSGINNSNYGKSWLSNPTTKQVICVERYKINDYLKSGWIKKRILNWNNFYADTHGICRNSKYYTDIKHGKTLDDILLEKQRKLKEKANVKELYKAYYEEYKLTGYKGVIKKFNYTKSKANLVQQFKRYVSNYKPKKNKHK